MYSSQSSTFMQLPYVSVPSYDPDDPAYIVAPGTGFDGVVNITDGAYTGSGVLLQTGRHILTAAHVVEDMPAYTINVNGDFVTGRQTFDVASVTLHPFWTGNWGYDLAILELATPMPADGFAIYEGSNEIGQIKTLVGYGHQATGTSGLIEPDYDIGEVKRKGNNRWEAFDSDIENAGFAPKGNAPTDSLLFSDFDNGSVANDALGYYLGIHDLGLGSREVASTGGDSGGPSFLYVNGEWQVAGIVNGGMTTTAAVDYTYGLDASYGELSFDTRVSYFADWINSVTGGATPVTDDFAPDNTSTNGQIAVGSTQSGQLEVGGDTDWFRVSLDAGQQYRFNLNGDFDTYFYLYDRYGRLIAENDNNGTSLNSQLDFTANTTGNYFAVAAAFDNGVSGSYTLSVNSTNPVDPAQPSALDDYQIVQRGIVSRGEGNDTYIIATPTVDAYADITLTDTQGSNVIQLMDGLELASFRVASDALQLQLTNATQITIMGASDFTYEIGGNPFAGNSGTLLSYNQLVINELGITSGVPGSGIVDGGGVIINNNAYNNIKNTSEDTASEDQLILSGVAETVESLII